MLRNFISVYFNPKEPEVNLCRLRADFRRTFFRHSIQFKTPKSLDTLSQDIQTDLQNGVDTFACVGGDGTVNRLLREVHPSRAKIFVLPQGTANDLGDQLGLSKIVRRMKRIVQYQTLKDVDVIDVNGAPFITHGGVGVGARLCDFMNVHRDRSRSFFDFVKKLKADSYGVTLIKQLLTEPMPVYSITIRAPHLPPEGMKVESPLIVISNQPVIAGKLRIAPYTNNSDKTFCVSVFLTKTPWSFIEVFARLRLNKRITDPSTFFQFETATLSMEVHSTEPIPFFGDGDILMSGSHFEIGVRENPQTFFYEDPHCTYSSSYSLDEVPSL